MKEATKSTMDTAYVDWVEQVLNKGKDGEGLDDGYEEPSV